MITAAWKLAVKIKSSVESGNGDSGAVAFVKVNNGL